MIYRINTDYKRGIEAQANKQGVQLDMFDYTAKTGINTFLTIEQAKELGEKLIELSKTSIPKFYLKIMDKYVNYDTCDGRYFLANAAETGIIQTQFTLEEINSEPKLKEYAEYKIPVNSAVSW